MAVKRKQTKIKGIGQKNRPLVFTKATLVFAWTDYEYIYVNTGALGIRDFGISYGK